jgi:hypothetical protein
MGYEYQLYRVGACCIFYTFLKTNKKNGNY